jgi:hypothetical protein
MALFSTLIATHVILTTAGYVGLIAANLWLLMLSHSRDARALAAGVRSWRRSARLFGPMLGVGVLAGFALALTIHVPLGAAWLIATYVLILLAMGAQGRLMIPWQLAADAAIARGEPVSTRTVTIVLSIFSVAYVAIVTLMLLRPQP